MSVITTLVPLGIAAAAGLWSQRKAKGIEAKAGKAVHVERSVVVPTGLRDEGVLREALEQLGFDVKRSDDRLAATRGEESPVLLTQGDDENGFDAFFDEGFPPAEAEAWVEDLYGNYAEFLQQRTHQRILEHAAEHGLQVESERVEDDNTIVVTLRVGNG